MVKCPRCGREIPSDARFCPYCGVSVEVSRESVEYIREQIAEYRWREAAAGIAAGVSLALAFLFFAMSRAVVYEAEWRCIISWGSACLVPVPEFRPVRLFETLGIILGVLCLAIAAIAIADGIYSWKKREELMEKLRYAGARS